jgi:membrane protein YdbS with pleckstrin-like domain
MESVDDDSLHRNTIDALVAAEAENTLSPAHITVSRLNGLVFAAVLAGVWLAALAAYLLFDFVDPLTLTISAIAIALITIFAWVWPPVAWRHTRYRVDHDGLRLVRGVWWRTVTTVPRSRVQHTDVTQGPVERRFGLATLVVYTAGTAHAEVGVPGLDYPRALELRDVLVGVSARP